METKSKIRKEILIQRDKIPEKEHKRMSREIATNIHRLPEFIKASKVLLFVGYGSEPDTTILIEDCLKKGKRVFCPCVCGEEMEFFEIRQLSDLKEGYKGILEPEAAEPEKYVPEAQDFMLMPGTVFDMEGNRIGYGKGFYDRYLAGGFTAPVAAAAFSMQFVENGRIPAEETDQKIHCIVTEKEIIRI